MTSDPKAMGQKLWEFCDVLRDDGLSYGDYLEQLTYLLFLKMADEQHELLGQRVVPIGYDWATLLNRSGSQLEAQYNTTLAELGHTTTCSAWCSARPATASRTRPSWSSSSRSSSTSTSG